MKVKVTYKETGEILMVYEIKLTNLWKINLQATESEYFDEAWFNVLYDDLAPISSRDDFCFEIMRD
jgi:hypothetical protein